MSRTWQLKNIVLLVVVGGVLAGAMGPSCVIIPVLPETPDPVTVEITNSTGNQVQALLWSDPDLLDVPDDLMLTPPYNLGPPLNPGTETTLPETASVTLTCEEAGTLVVDGNLILVPTGSIPSDNVLLLREGVDFVCGDTVSFYYELDVDSNFFTSVDVNGVYLAP